MRSRRRFSVALLFVVAAIALSALFVSTAAALPTFTQAVGGVGPCETCHGGAYPVGVHAAAPHAGFITSCSTCHTVNTATPPLPASCAANNCHGGAVAILTAHAGQPAPAAGCATTAGCHGVPAAAAITAITPAQAEAGANVTITGSGFGATQGAGTVMFGAVAATVVSWSDTSIVVTVPALSAGAVQVVVTPAGGTATAGFSFTVQAPGVDTVAPTVTYTGVVNGKWYNRSKTITFTAKDNTGGSGVASITYSVNAATPVVVTTTAKAEVMIDVNRTTHAGDGPYVVTYFATDVAGNPGTSKTVTIKIDTRKPVTVAMANVRVVQNQTVRLAYKITDAKPNAGKATVMIKIKTRSGKTVKTVRLGVQTVNKQHYAKIKANLKPGAYKYYIYAKDTAGNTQANVANKAFIVRAATSGGFNG